MKPFAAAIFGSLCNLIGAVSDSIQQDFRNRDSGGFCTKDNCAIKDISRPDVIIDESLNELAQDDSRLIGILKERYLVPPSKEPYNLPINDDEWDIYKHEEEKAYPLTFGQYGQPRAVDK